MLPSQSFQKLLSSAQLNYLSLRRCLIYALALYCEHIKSQMEESCKMYDQVLAEDLFDRRFLMHGQLSQ